MLNVTVTNTTAASFLTVYGTSSSRPLASNLNWKAGQTIPNLVETPVGANGSVTFYNAAGSTDVVADLEGYYFAPNGSAGGEVALTPARITDTRAGSGQANAGSTLGAGQSLAIQATGAGGVPSAGVSGVILNVTVTNTTAASFLTVWPTGAPQNVVSNLNWVAGQTIPNRVFVPVGTGGKVSVFNAAGSTDVVVDVSGYFTDSTTQGQTFTPQIPLRIEDTRSDGKTLAPNTSFSIQVGGVAGVPVTAKAVILNVTATDTTASSFLTVYPSTATRPLASDLNWTAGVTIPNLTVATLGSNGMVSFYNAAGSTDVVVDLFGFFGGGAGVNITATPASLAADGVSTSKIDVTVTDINGNPVALDPVSLTTTPSVAGACGGLSSNSGTTGANGKIPTITYTASITPGTCKITATELIKGQNASVTITQTPPVNSVTINPTSECDFCSINVDGNGTSTVSFSVHVQNPVTAAAVAGDLVTVTNTANASTPGACGTNGTLSGTPAGTTDASGNVTWTYTSSAAVGYCNVKAMEAATGGSDTVLVTQNIPNGVFFNGVALTGTTTSTATGGACSGCNVQIFANGKDTVSLKETVTGPSQASDVSTFTFTFNSPSGSCGTIAPQTGTTNVNGVLNATYTASTTVGECDVTVTESNSGNTAAFFIGQDQVPATVTLTANPSTLAAVNTNTSTLTVTATSGIDGSPLNGDTITFSTAPNPAGACGAISGGPFKTNASGQATATYTATAVPGFCHITANDTTSLGSATARITQTNPVSATFGTTVVANPTSIPADNVTPATSTITATVKTSGGTPAGAGDLVEFVKSGSVSGVCSGTVSATTNASGVASFVYTASSTVGTCTITATEANSGSSGSATVAQTAVPNKVTVTPGAAGIPVATTTTLAVHVAHLGTAVASDQITFSTSGSPSGACGTIDTLAPATGKTDSSGNVTAVYHASATPGFCTVTATEGLTGSTGSTTITQTTQPPATNTVAVTDNKAGTVVADGTSTATLTATVAGTNTVGDQIMWATSPSVAGACGTITPITTNTGTGTTVTATYRASTTAGTCHITATEANGNAPSPAHDIVQSQKPNNITIAANPTIVSVSGAGTSAISVNVTDGNTSAAVVGDHITFLVTGAGCGTVTGITPASGNTDSSGNVTATYNVGATVGSCSVKATEIGTGASASVTITQIA
jgi:hypothetical protein